MTNESRRAKDSGRARLGEKNDALVTMEEKKLLLLPQEIDSSFASRGTKRSRAHKDTRARSKRSLNSSEEEACDAEVLAVDCWEEHYHTGLTSFELDVYRFFFFAF